MISTFNLESILSKEVPKLQLVPSTMATGKSLSVKKAYRVNKIACVVKTFKAKRFLTKEREQLDKSHVCEANLFLRCSHCNWNMKWCFDASHPIREPLDTNYFLLYNFFSFLKGAIEFKNEILPKIIEITQKSDKLKNIKRIAENNEEFFEELGEIKKFLTCEYLHKNYFFKKNKSEGFYIEEFNTNGNAIAENNSNLFEKIEISEKLLENLKIYFLEKGILGQIFPLFSNITELRAYIYFFLGMATGRGYEFTMIKNNKIQNSENSIQGIYKKLNLPEKIELKQNLNFSIDWYFESSNLWSWIMSEEKNKVF